MHGRLKCNVENNGEKGQIIPLLNVKSKRISLIVKVILLVPVKEGIEG